MPDTIKALYPIALAEGEGVGTAYEYYKRENPRLCRGDSRCLTDPGVPLSRVA